MARVRMLKPEFFRNEDVASCEPMARLLFAGLWTIADREGRVLDRPRRIAADLFPYETAPAVDAWLDQLAARGLIARYTTSDGRPAIQVTMFARHQRPHFKEPPSEIEAPTAGCGQSRAYTVGQSPNLAQIGSRSDPSYPDPDPVSDPDHSLPCAPARDLSAQTPALAPSTTSEAATEAAPKRWPAHRWEQEFGAAWCAKYQRLAYGTGSIADAKATGWLADHLASLPQAEAHAAEARAPEMLREFLGDGDPKVVKARHPWSFFVTAFRGLSVAAAPAAAPNGRAGPVAKPPDPRCEWHQQPRSNGKRARRPRDGCPECKHVAALARERTVEVEPASSGELLARWQSGAGGMTQEQLAELTAKRKAGAG